MEGQAHSFLTKAQYDEWVVQWPYYQHRWEYFSRTIGIMQSLQFTTALELAPGPSKRSLIEGADTMDRLSGCTYQHDATVFPWPFTDKQYDLFVSLQAWEHLENSQVAAFGEVRRIARSAILSFPHAWKPVGSKHYVTKAQMAEWTHHLPPTTRIYCHEFGSPRIIMHWSEL